MSISQRFIEIKREIEALKRRVDKFFSKADIEEMSKELKQAQARIEELKNITPDNLVYYTEQ